MTLLNDFLLTLTSSALSHTSKLLDKIVRWSDEAQKAAITVVREWRDIVNAVGIVQEQT